MHFQFPEHWIADPGKRIKNIHLKEFTKKGTDIHARTRFARCWTAPPTGPPSSTPSIGSATEGYLTFEYFHPYLHYPEALIYQTADSLDRMLGIKA